MSSINSSKKMTYVRLGNSGLKVSRLILGLGSYGNKTWYESALEEEDGIKQIKAAYDAGIQTFDTANSYAGGDSERILGKAIKQLNLPRDEIVVMTKLEARIWKVYFPVAPTFTIPSPAVDAAGYVNQYGLGRKHIFESIKHSLERLQLDYVDVLQCHWFDEDTPIAETMQALHDVVKAGYARYIGMSNCAAYQFHAMQNYAINNKLTPFISVQNQYNLICREEEREMIPTLKMFGVGLTPYSPVAQGLLSRQYSQPSPRAALDPRLNQMKEHNKEVILRLEKIAQSRGASMGQVAIAWHLSKTGVTPIIGASTPKSLEDTIGAIDIKLTDEEIRALEEPYVAQPLQGQA
ncbi:Putative aryl-alcohol dehydrogenase C977.14c [Rhizoctonia solani AG-1 IB]|uniref:Putative aryl-alcohol dehydrogenase C977.14c n=1 Tax=Thanatephorus cucumeris (strain AG1-IB / isolate 7/3/14) TaxID=1108050 RepID=M5C8S1_THACB|nr:Putative aryl-alcohol dehydrogenase C977.14c [Rhizoctonia solani AG-1 IB]